MAEHRVLVAGAVLYRRLLETTTVAGYDLAQPVGGGLGGGGAVAGLAASALRPGIDAEVRLLAQVGHDSAGAWCRDALARRGVVTEGLAVHGVTGEHLVLEPPSHEPRHVLLPGRSDGRVRPPFALELGRCAPGDALVVDALMLASTEHRWIVEAAYQADLQVVVDLHPVVIEAMTPDVLQYADVVVVDPAGAGVAADRGISPATLAVYDPALGSWWDDLRHDPVGMPQWESPGDATHAFAGVLGACLAYGMDRPEAFATAVRAALSDPCTLVP